MQTSKPLQTTSAALRSHPVLTYNQSFHVPLLTHLCCNYLLITVSIDSQFVICSQTYFLLKHISVQYIVLLFWLFFPLNLLGQMLTFNI